MSQPCRVLRFDTLGYAEAELLQNELVTSRKLNQVTDTLLVLEHPPVLTLGRAADLTGLRVAPEALEIPLIRTGRGGQVTYHGPGQLVFYPILQLDPAERDLHRYLRKLELVAVAVAADHGVATELQLGRTGVWVGERKLASIGVRASGWVTSHGLSLNYGPDLRGFEWIRPCGLDIEMTSLSVEKKIPVPRSSVERSWSRHFARIFERKLESGDPREVQSSWAGKTSSESASRQSTDNRGVTLGNPI